MFMGANYSTGAVFHATPAVLATPHEGDKALDARCHYKIETMADASHDDLVVQFTSVTGADAERAKFYLESAAWSLDVNITINLVLSPNGIQNPKRCVSGGR